MQKNIQFSHLKTDVIVVGGGLAGLTAARTLSQTGGKKITIICDGTGSSAFIHGINTPVGNDDSVDCFISDTLKSGSFQGNKELVRKLCEGSTGITTFFEGLEVELDRRNGDYALLHALGSSVPRVVSSGNLTGSVLMNRIRAELKDKQDIELLNSTRALRLMITDGAVRGVLTYDLKENRFVFFETEAVILASGGFCNIYPFSTNTGDIGGDGIAMAYNSGALLTDLEFVQFEPCAAVFPEKISGEILLTTMFFEGAVLRNKDGERFALNYGPSGERVNKDVLSIMMSTEVINGRGSPHGGVYFDATAMDEKKLKESYSTYVKRYADCKIDISREWVEVAPAPHTSIGGVVISTDCSTTVPGLFACGEVVGGIHGANRLGGNASLETIVFGKAAGEAVCSYIENDRQKAAADESMIVRWIEEVLYSGQFTDQDLLDSVQIKEIRSRMEELLLSSLNAVRDGEHLAAAKNKLEKLYSAVEKAGVEMDNEAIFNWLRLRNDLLTAMLLSEAAAEREKSIGCHNRSDSTADDSERYRIEIRKTDDAGSLKKILLEE